MTNNTTNLTHLPADVLTALVNYDEMVNDGTIAFDKRSEFASDKNHGFITADAELIEFVAQHVHYL